MPAPGSIINGFGPGIFALLFGAINLNIQEISVTMRGACNDPGASPNHAAPFTICCGHHEILGCVFVIAFRLQCTSRRT